MNKVEARKLLYEKIEFMRSIDMACNVMMWDEETKVLHKRSLSMRAEALSCLEAKLYNCITDKTTLDMIDSLEDSATINQYEKALIRDLKYQHKKLTMVPSIEMQNYKKLCAQTAYARKEAIRKNNYAHLLQLCNKIFEYNRRFCDMYGYEHHPYDALLNNYERGMSVKFYDTLFDELSCKLSVLIQKLHNISTNYVLNKRIFESREQYEVFYKLAKLLMYDTSKGEIAEVEHPFCLVINRYDVRIGLNFNGRNILLTIFEILHELGHAIYEQNINIKLEKFALAGVPSTGMHESQAWIFENLIGKSRTFTSVLLQLLQRLFPDFNNFSEEKLYYIINCINLSSARINADELTYHMHISARYKFEKYVIEHKLKDIELPELWSAIYKSTFGTELSNSLISFVEDPHWFEGQVGIFPSYIVGAVYASQFMCSLMNAVDIDSAILNSDFSKIIMWLKDNIYQYGAYY